MKKSIFLLSSSSVHGHGFLEYNKPDIETFLKGVTTPILFVPFAAGKDEWDGYTSKVRAFFTTIGMKVKGIHTVSEEKMFTDHEVIFIGGGNTFRLLNELQQRGLLPRIREAVMSGKMAYMGSSAGTNMATLSVKTTNDMPIIYPAGGFDALNLFPYQINPHYLDADPTSSHMGETRAQRISEFHQENDTPVFGLREGSYILISPDCAATGKMFIGRKAGARVFLKGKQAFEAPTDVEFSLSELEAAR